MEVEQCIENNGRRTILEELPLGANFVKCSGMWKVACDYSQKPTVPLLEILWVDCLNMVIVKY